MTSFGALVAVTASLAASAVLSSQTTHYVQGANFAAAVAAAAPGDVLLVSGTLVTGLLGTTVDKPLHIHALPGARVEGWLVISGIPASGSVALTGFAEGGLGLALRIVDCAGLVLVSDVTAIETRVINSARVAIDGLRDFDPARQRQMIVQSSTVVLTRCTLRGRPGNRRYPPPASSALDLIQSTMVAVDCDFVGGESQELGFATTPGIAMHGSDLRLSGRSRVFAGGSRSTEPRIEAVVGSGTLTYDPATVFDTPVVPPIRAGITTRVLGLPVTTALPSSLGSLATVRVRGGANEAFALLGVLAGPRTPIPGIEGELWLQSPNVVTLGVLDAQGEFALSFFVPVADVLRALPFGWQGLTMRNGTLLLAEPATESHR